jgi:DNA-binding PadR family transcriptional regulator
MLEFILLGFLKCGEMSGYQMKQCMAESTSNFFDASFGSIYPTLKKLEKGKLISMRGVVEGGKFKKMYSITESGAAAFMQWLQEPIDFSKIRPDHLVKIFFFSFLPKEKAAENIRYFQRKVEEVLNKLRHQEKNEGGNADGFMLATLRFGIEYYSFIMTWCDDLIKKIKGGEL